MDILDKVAKSHAFMLATHRDFLALIEEFKNERREETAPDPQFYSDEVEDRPSLYSHPEAEEEGIYDCDDEFPMTRKAFDYRNIDMEDPAFWGGKEIGIPMGLLVHGENGEGKLLPIKNGLFVDEDGEY
jgi:hypothetical protein